MSTRAQDLMFEAWIAEMPAAIAGFESRLRGTGFRADFTRGSLEDLERSMRDRWASGDVLGAVVPRHGPTELEALG